LFCLPVVWCTHWVSHCGGHRCEAAGWVLGVAGVLWRGVFGGVAWLCSCEGEVGWEDVRGEGLGGAGFDCWGCCEIELGVGDWLSSHVCASLVYRSSGDGYVGGCLFATSLSRCNQIFCRLIHR
jgi:hypothetical protein